MADWSGVPGPAIEAFASRHARRLLVTAYLLTGDWVVAEDAAAHAIVAGARAGYRDGAGEDFDDDAVRAAVVAAARRNVRARGPWWSRDGGLHLQEAGTRPGAAVDDPDGLWAGLLQLTEHERAAIVLRDHEGMEREEIAAALGRSPAEVARDLTVGYDVVAQAAGRLVDGSDAEVGLRGIFGLHRDLSPSTAGAVRRALALRHRRSRARMAGLAAGIAVAVGAAAWGAVAIAGDDTTIASASGSYVMPTSPPPWALNPRAASLPEVGPDRKLVGFQDVMVAVPASWTQVTADCDGIRRNAVVFPVGRDAALCGDEDLPRGVSAVSFNRDTAGDPEVQGDFGPRRGHGYFIVMEPSKPGGRYVAYAAAPGLRFGMSIATTSRRTLDRIIDSMTVVPPGYTTVPECVGLRDSTMTSVMYGRGLVPEPRYDHSALGMPLEVAQQSQSVGTVVPVQTHITLGLLPR